ncbi:MAG: YkgJ family cysteine cluster protein [Candidatus Omnitrophica bacterium]|nr:YkgJ family cysteine cluster protein [Candidatus Omnitrophota bacterium]
MVNLKQFVDQETCLACRGCCRFYEEKSLWRPKLTKQEAAYVSEEIIDEDYRVKSVVSGSQYLCSFLDEKTSLCRKYVERPFECVLYPFVLVKDNDKVMVAVHLACPFVQEKRASGEFSQYRENLKNFFSSVEDKSDISALAQAYPDASQELDILFSI